VPQTERCAARISVELVVPAALPLGNGRVVPRRATLRSQAIILPDVAADLAGRDQPIRYLLLHVPEADLFALQPTSKPVKGCYLRAGRKEQRHVGRYMA